MIRRAIPLLVVLTLAFAPVTRDLCHALCLLPASTHAGHHDHGPAAAPVEPAAGALMAPVSHVCDVSSDQPATSAPTPYVPAVETRVIVLPPPELRSCGVATVAGTPSPPRISLKTQLRV